MELLILENSGLTHPAPVIRSLIDNSEKWDVSFEGLITLIDGQNFLTQENEFLLVKEQISQADFIIVSKTDLISKNELQVLIHRLKN